MTKPTREEILNEPAGSRMNIWIAQYKFGYDLDGKHPNLPIRFVGAPPDYSFDISAAWEVVEKLVSEGYCPALIYDDSGHWALSFDGMQSFPVAVGGDPDEIFTTCFVPKIYWCNTAPLAICRAALLALLEPE